MSPDSSLVQEIRKMLEERAVLKTPAPRQGRPFDPCPACKSADVLQFMVEVDNRDYYYFCKPCGIIFLFDDKHKKVEPLHESLEKAPQALMQVFSAFLKQNQLQVKIIREV